MAGAKRFFVEAGLLAMQAPRSIRYTELMPSRASPLPHLSAFNMKLLSYKPSTCDAMSRFMRPVGLLRFLQ
ncbi:hypothetical protein AO240_23050 [Pseudomonas sp. ICMP 460]|nr:hypothetical protein AO240_23050 [Pseudomonas sp. ICMP 460]